MSTKKFLILLHFDGYVPLVDACYEFSDFLKKTDEQFCNRDIDDSRSAVAV